MKAKRITGSLIATLLLAACADDVPVADGGGPADGPTTGDDAQPSSAPLATFVKLDWDAFPVDPGPNYPVKGRVWVVKTTGKDGSTGTVDKPLRTIVGALARAGSGDLVRVHGGTYAEGLAGEFRAVVLKKPVVLTAAAGETVTVTPRTSHYGYGIAVESGDVVINGVNLDGFRSAAIQIGSSSASQKNVVISNLTITGASANAEGIMAYDDTTAKGFATSDGLLVKNVLIRKVLMGVSCNRGPCKSWHLENVTISGVSGAGSGSDGVAIEKGDNFLFHKVDVSRVAADGIDTKATRVVVWACHVHDLGRNGVKLWHGGDIVNTLIHHTGADAAVVTDQGPRTRLLHSVVAHHNKGGNFTYIMSFGYDSRAPQTVELVNSIIYNSSGGVHFTPMAKVTVNNTLFYGMDNGVMLESGKGKLTLAGGAKAIEKLGLGSGNVVADPLFDNAFHLRSGSPAADGGKKLGSLYPKLDRLGKKRLKGKAPDLGAHEDF